METIDKIVIEKIWVTEYLDHCPLPEKPENLSFEDEILGINYTGIKLSKNNEWVFKLRYLDEDKTLKDFGNPLCSVDISRGTLCLEEDENKISLKFFQTSKSRRVGCTWFKRKSDISFVTYNKKTKNFYSGRISNYDKRKKSKKINCNHFYNHMNAAYSSMIVLLRQPNEEFNSKEPNPLIDQINELYSKFYLKLGIDKRDNYYDITSDLYSKYLKDKQIKAPNNFMTYKHAGKKPPARLFKKNGNKLVETYMQYYDIKGDKFRKVLHKVNKLDFNEIKNLINLFGIDFLTQRPETELTFLIESPNFLHFYEGVSEVTEFINKVTKKEKMNIYQTLLSFYKHDFGLHAFNDHIKFYKEISKYENVRWNSVDSETFGTEHSIFADKYSFYTKGYYEREYNESFLNYIQQPFIVDGLRYSPVLLQTNAQYIEESAHQSNCVKTYNGNIGSIIISLRDENNERLTMQFIPKKFENGKVTWKNAQTRARFNYKPSEKWNEAISVVENKLSYVTDFQLPNLYYINFKSKRPINLTWDLSGSITAMVALKEEFDYYDVI
jgi:hypothetical protein